MDVSATAAESAGPVAGDELLTEQVHQSTRAISIDAPPRHVWRWLESGLHPGTIRPGDKVQAGPPGHPDWVAASVDFPRALVLRAPRATWSFELRPLDGGLGTRLLVRTRMPDDVLALFVDPVELVFERRMLLGIREQAERVQFS